MIGHIVQSPEKQDGTGASWQVILYTLFLRLKAN
jgi:hypothetical protein